MDPKIEQLIGDNIFFTKRMKHKIFLAKCLGGGLPIFHFFMSNKISELMGNTRSKLLYCGKEIGLRSFGGVVMSIMMMHAYFRYKHKEEYMEYMSLNKYLIDYKKEQKRGEGEIKLGAKDIRP